MKAPWAAITTSSKSGEERGARRAILLISPSSILPSSIQGVTLGSDGQTRGVIDADEAVSRNKKMFVN